MMTMVIVVAVVSGALLVGAIWGLYGKLGRRTESFLVAMAGGALLLSVSSELIEPALADGSVLIAAIGVLAGAVTFALADSMIDRRVGPDSGGGLLVAITLDGIPENLALGVALIGSTPMEVAALAGSILLSNLPEAAGGARDMAGKSHSRGKILALWGATALLLAGAAIGGRLFLDEISGEWLAAIRCFAAGAVIASLAMEVFPKAYREKWHWVGVATALGVIMALGLAELG
ncbi:ZIP family metal transporter [Pseudopontixanthobacter vadosimaris]|uniref:ZIP family metal transporter n=1 Tax=Pseudopontixanthobacter vadosimaris TaxID=2726450 RepID=UPI001473D6E0|nr:zinc transporter [Pseudopontixanthobacter vadosimaris]